MFESRVLHNKETHVARLKQQLDQVRSQIAEAEAKIEEARRVQAENEQDVADLREALKKGQEALGRLEAAPGDVWEEIGQDLDASWASLQRSVEDLTAKLKRQADTETTVS